MTDLPDSVVAPLDAADRLHALDILRGLALFGMILVHFHQRMRVEVQGIEDLIGWGVYVLIEQKSWGTFAFLFGVGFAVLLRRLESRHVPVAPVYLRRLAMLAAFGVISYICFGFQVLFSYASWGVVLLLIRRWSTRALLIAAALSAMALPLTAEATAIYAWWTSSPASTPYDVSLVQAVRAASTQNDYLALLAARARLFVFTMPQSWRAVLPDTNLALFIIGLLAVRHRVLDEPARHRRLIVAWMIGGAAAWALSWLVLRRLAVTSVPGVEWPIKYGLGLIQDQWLCFTYIGAVVLLLAQRPWWSRRLIIVAQTGRMALTNYMLQAAVLDFLASGYGLGWHLRPAMYVPATLALFGAEALLSRAWLARYRFGPLEWLWRSATYMRWQPLRRQLAEPESELV
jgi:uncharacterized protein